MATQVKFRRGSQAEHDSFIGATGEITVNTDDFVPHVHDGVIAGGTKLFGKKLPLASNAGYSNAILDIPITGGNPFKLWANRFSQNFVLGDGGSNLNEASSGTKDGNNNFVMGLGALPVATTTYASTAIGYNAANAVTTANSLTAVGYQAGLKVTTGNNNSLFGVDAGFSLTTGNNNTLIGRHIFFNPTLASTGSNNACVGYDIGLEATTFNDMVVMGANAQRDGITSARSVTLGTSVAQAVNTVNDSVLIGRQASQNVPATTAITNTVEIGARVNENALSNTANAIVGYNSFFTIAQGGSATSGNAALGSQSGSRIYGSFNTLIGTRAAAQTTDTELTGAVCIGYRAGDGHAADNDLIIANSQSVANALINGNFSTRVLQLEATALTLKNLPTVGTGASGTLWNDAGTVKVVA